ncbi:outer membrane protein assembly factor BamA [Maritimibacter sp. 55A14]|nr:outer membrane protein assembly factor BamA [Maritimibacter sp. 55A14]
MRWVQVIAGMAFLTLVLALILPAGPAASQSYRFTSVVVEGNQRIESSSIETFAGIPRGQAVTTGAVNDAYQNLIGTGLFESVEVVPQGAQLLIRVREFPTISRINFEGNKRLNDEALTAIVESQPRRVYNPAQAERDANNIADAYRQTGRMAARVKPVIIRRTDNRVDLIFEIREGGVVEVERLSFVGNRSFSDRRLRRVLQTKQAGILRRIIGSDTYIADRIDFDRQELTDFYSSRGYVDFEILSVTQEFSRDRDAFFLTFHIREGQSFEFGEITTVSDLPEIDPEKYHKVLRIRPGITYSPALVDRAIARMERLAVRDGLDFIRVEPRITRNDADLTLDVEFDIIRGERVFIERIDIEGNTTTVDRVIRRQFHVVEGDPFNPREIRQAAQRIRALGFFANSDVNASEGSGPEQRIIDVNVEEQPTGTLSLGLSFSTDDGPGIGASFEERNFLGRGQFLRFAVNTAQETRTLDLDFREPGFLDRDLGVGMKLFFRRRTDQDNAEFDTQSIGFQPSIDFPVSENGRLQLRYRISEDQLSGVDANNSPIIQRDEGSFLTSAVGFSYSYDTRRTGLDPTAGVILTFSSDVAGLGGDVEYVKSTALIGAQKRIRNEEITLSAELEVGGLIMLSDDSRLTDRFNLSSQQMRGFDFRGIGPRDVNSVNQDGLGGNYFAVARFEAQFPVGLPEEFGVRGGVFLDVGSLWGLDDTIGTGGVPVDDGFALRSAIGFSVFWQTGLGPLRFNFSKALMKEPEDETRAFDFTVSTQF